MDPQAHQRVQNSLRLLHEQLQSDSAISEGGSRPSRVHSHLFDHMVLREKLTYFPEENEEMDQIVSTMKQKERSTKKHDVFNQDDENNAEQEINVNKNNIHVNAYLYKNYTNNPDQTLPQDFCMPREEDEDLEESENSSDEQVAELINLDLKKQASKGKRKMTIEEFLDHCHHKVLLLIKKKNKQTESYLRTKFNSMINSQLLRLKKRLEEESRIKSADQTHNRLQILVSTIMERLTDVDQAEVYSELLMQMSETPFAEENFQEFLERVFLTGTSPSDKYSLMQQMINEHNREVTAVMNGQTINSEVLSDIDK